MYLSGIRCEKSGHSLIVCSPLLAVFGTHASHAFWTNDRIYEMYLLSTCRQLCLAVDFVIDTIYVRFGNSVFRQVIGIPMGTKSAPLLADLFVLAFKYNFMLKTMKAKMSKAVEFSNTFRYIDDLFSVNNDKRVRQKPKTSTSGLLISLSLTATTLPLRRMVFAYFN